MAELYAKPFETIETGYNPQQPQGDGQQGEMEAYLSSLPPEERQAAIERINAPLSGEELAMMAQSGQKMPTIAEYAEIEKWHKGHEISFFDGLGKIAEGGAQVMEDLSKAFGAVFDNPSDVASKMPATAVEAFAQGTRNFYGMLAQSGNPDSTLFKVKDFLNGTGTIEDRYNQYIEALKFNRDSADLAEGKTTMVMDKDMINHEVTQAMAYIADPTLFIPFGKVASTGLRAVGLGEKLTMAGARAAAIKNGILGNTLKWGAGQPLEFMGGAVRNTIDYGLEKAGAAFEATTGMEAKQFAQTARMSGIGFSASAVAGHAVPYASTLSDAYIVGSSAKGFGEALTLIGETMSKNKFGRGINSWAAEALQQAEKNGVALSPHAKGLLKTLNAVDPLFAYGWNGLETAAEGSLIGGGLGYLSGGQEGMYSGIGAGIALGAVGGTAGKVVADVTGGTNVARRAVQAKMVIEGHKVTNPEKAMFFQAMQKATEARGQDVDLVNSIIAGIDKVAPNFEFHAMTPEQFAVEAVRKGYNPLTGKFAELSAIDHEFGGDRTSKSRAMYILRSVGGDFVGNSKAFLEALKKASAKDSANPNKPASNIPLALRKYTDVAKTFDKLTKTQQDAILKEIDGQADVAKELGGSTKLREHYDALSWSEAWTDSLVKKFESDREGARKDITDMLAQETKKDGKMTKKGRALVDKLRNEGFLDKEGKLLRQRNLLQADMTLGQFSSVKGGVIRREADGKTHMYINLNLMGSETFPHELFHTVMRESPMKDHFTKSLIQKLVGTFDDKGRLVRKGEVNINQLRKFFKKYVDLTSFDEDGSTNLKKAEDTMTAIETALKEYETYGDNKKISEKSRDLLENYTEEFGAYYFSHWLMGRNRNTLFFGGELKGIEGLVERTKDGFMDFWQSKISKANPKFDFSRGLNESFDRSKGLGRISAIDYYMRDMVRAASNANRDVFRPDSMTLENLRDFETSNGLRNLTTQNGSRRLNPPERKRQNQTLGKEGFKILSGLDKNLRTSKDTIDENGKPVITGRLSEAELDALVKGGIVPRAWADKVNQGYAMLDGTVSNIFSAGYLGNTEQTTDASYPRLTGKDVSFKNRKAVLFDVETKIKADGTFYTLFHTLDLAVIEQRGNHLWQNTDYRNLWNGDRGSMEADFFAYISNASKASTDITKQDSSALLEKGDGLGAQRRDVLQQMAGMALQTGDAYKHQPIAVIPEGIRHSVTTFNIDGLTTPRVEQGARYDIDMKNAHKFIRENWQPDDMRQEKTPAGRVLTHESGFKFTQDANGKVSAYTSAGAKIGTFNSIKEATVAGKNKFNEVYKNHDAEVKKVFEKKNEEAKRFQALDENERQEAIRNGDLFSLERVKNFIGNRKVLRQSREEFIISKVIEAVENPEILKNAVRKALFSTNKTAFEYRKLLQEFVKVGEEEKRLADEHGVLYERWLRTIDADERSMLSQKMTENSEAAQVLQVQRPKAKFNLERFELEMKKARVDAFVELQNSLSHLTQEQFTEVVKNELMLTYNPELGGKYKAIKKAHSGIAETLFAEAFDDQTQTGVPIVVVGTHGTRNVELMISRILLDEKLGTRYGTAAGGKAYSSDLGHFMGGSTDTSYSYAGLPPSAFTLYAKNGIPINRLAEFLGDGAFLNPYNFPESHPIYSLNKAIFELKKNSQKVNDALLFKAQDAYLELFDKGSSLSYDDLLAKAREVQGILAHLKDIGFIKPNAHKLLIDFTVEAFDKSVRKERPNPISRDEFNYHINNAESLVIDSAFNALDEVRVSIDELLGGGLKNQDKEIKLPEGKSIKVKYDNELYKEVIKLSQETINTLTDTTNGWMGKTNFENKVKMVLGGKKFYEGSSTVDPARTWMQIRGLMAFDNPKVIIDPRGYDESKLAPQMIQAINEGHDGIIFKRLRDGGSEDDIYIQLKGNQNKILTIDTSFDSQHIPRKDENGNVLKTGRDIGLALQPDEVDAPKQVQGIKLDMTKAYDVFRQEYEESTGQSWSQDKFMQRARNWQFFGDENGFVAVRPQRSGFVKLVGMAGDNKSKLRGIQQIQQQGLPIWGMVSKEIKDMAVKRGMREPNMIERTVLKQALNSAALGDAEILGYTSDNGVRLRYPDIGEVVKYMIGSPEYYQKLRSDFGDQIKSKIGFQPDEGEQGGRTYTPEQMAGKFIGRVASENPKLTKYKKIVFTKDTEKGKLGEDTYRLTIKPKDEVASEVKVGYINVEVNGTDATVEYVKVNPRWEGEGYGKLLYSEMVERLRSLGVKEFSGMIIDESGRPQKIRKRIIDQENTRIGEPDDTLIGRTRRDRYGDTQTDVTSYLKEKAWYQPDEKIGTQSSNIKLLLEGMASGRILRTSSYKNLGLEDASLIAHTPDTAKIGQVTAGDKALADLQGGIFYAIANGKKIWASNFAGEGETNILVQFANDQLKSNPNKKTYILLVKPSSGDNSKIFASVDGARGVSNIFKHLNDSKVMTDLRYVDALKNSAEMHLGIKGLEGLGKEELYARIDDALLNSKANKIGFEHRREFTREIARQLDEAGAFDSKRSKKALVKSFHKGFERGFSIVEMERVFGNLMAEDIIKDVPAGHVYGALEIASPLRETPDSGHRGYDASIEQESGDPARLIMFDRTDHVTNIVTKKSGKEIAIHKAGEGSYHSHTGGQIPYQEVKGKSQMPFQPAEFTQFTTEQTAAGRILKNAKGYAIMMVNNKFRVYSPAKVILGVYTDEEQAKNRIYKEIPKR